MTRYPPQEIRTEDLQAARLEDILRLTPPPGIDAATAFRQLRKIEEYVKDDEIGARTVLVESHYIDRDFMEDYSVFYSRSLLPINNYCQRAHFFRGSRSEVQGLLDQLCKKGRELEDEDFRRACRDFSREHYCGFSVIKPLEGTPVGRTVLCPFPPDPQPAAKEEGEPSSYSRLFLSARDYRTHVLGLELTVRGLAFQQQDVGVAACATTAIWTALQKTRETEDLAPSTPAHITTRATQSRLPFGRSMPSEGLSIDQMCQAVDSFGVSPVLTKVDSFRTARVELFTAVSSGLVPVLVVTKSDGGVNKHHAIAVVGAKRCETAVTRTTDVLNFGADHLEALYVHDDRIGPYLLARLDGGEANVLKLRIRTVKASGGAGTPELMEEWKVTHILTPMHAKVRLSIAELYRIAREIAEPVGAALQTALSKEGTHEVELDLAIYRSFRYLERILFEEPDFPSELARRVAAEVSMARYVAVIRLTVERVGSIDVLVDTTSTRRNPSYFGVVCDTSHRSVSGAGQALAEQLKCDFFGAEA